MLLAVDGAAQCHAAGTHTCLVVHGHWPARSLWPMVASHTDLTEPCNLWRDTAYRFRCREPAQATDLPSTRYGCRPNQSPSSAKRRCSYPFFCFKVLSFSFPWRASDPLPPRSSHYTNLCFFPSSLTPVSILVLVRFLSRSRLVLSFSSLTPPFR